MSLLMFEARSLVGSYRTKPRTVLRRSQSQSMEPADSVHCTGNMSDDKRRKATVK